MSQLKLFVGLLGVFVCAASVAAQSVPTPSPAAVESVPAASPTPSETEAAHRRIARARALAAIGKLAAAASELEALRSATTDESARDVSRVLLMSIFVEMPDYMRASALLDEAFAARASGGAAQQAYFALAGQTINAVRTHLERYRAFGLNVADGDLPSEANGDLEQLRALLERVVEQAKSIGGADTDATRGRDATALLEDAATVRMRVARANADDRARWQTEVSEARQRLFATDTRIASLSELPSARAAANQAAGRTSAAPTTNQSSATQQPAPQATNVRTSAPAAAPPAGTTTTAAAGGASNAAATSAPVSVGSLFAKARRRETPSYPSAARSARLAGVVTVFLLVNEKGEVETVERTDGPATLIAAAVEAARRWKFNPYIVNGQPVRVRGYLSFDFKP